MDEDGCAQTDCHEEKFAWSDHVHDAVGVLEHFGHHFFLCLGWRLRNEVSGSVVQSTSRCTLPSGCVHGCTWNTMNQIIMEGLKTHDAVHIEVKVVKFDTVWIWSGNVDWELDGLTQGIWDLDFIFFPDRCHWRDTS